MHPNLDDFTGLLGQDDACMLVDLLKLAVAARAGDTAKETVVSVLVGKCTYCVVTHDIVLNYITKYKDNFTFYLFVYYFLGAGIAQLL
jgi:hypothetical protein